jgi:branched-chain amino acid transport system permease protein
MSRRKGLQGGVRALLTLVIIWAVLLLAPYWMPPLGGYTALGTRVLVLALAAMSVNFLLGFTGVLSFGHAAYFGLGAYGAGLALKFVTLSTPLSILAGMVLAGIAGGLLGALIVRRRGVYFAMVTIAFGQVFYYIAFQWSSLTGGDDGLRGFSRQPLDFGLFTIDILSNANAFYYFALFFFAPVAGVMALILRSPFGRQCWRFARTSAASPFSSREWNNTSGSLSHCPAHRSPARFMHSPIISLIRAGCTTVSPAISS